MFAERAKKLRNIVMIMIELKTLFIIFVTKGLTELSLLIVAKLSGVPTAVKSAYLN